MQQFILMKWNQIRTVIAVFSRKTRIQIVPFCLMMKQWQNTIELKYENKNLT
jgi:hypothetical protein